ncbi:HAD family hydrolase [Roseibium sp. M-1]
MSTQSESAIQAIIFDWAGTTVDFGSRGPAMAFQAVFEASGFPVSLQEARQPMGLPKRDHIAQMLAIPELAERWRERFGRAPDGVDVDRLYKRFNATSVETILAQSDVVPGVPALVEGLRARGIRIGSTTGYTRDIIGKVAQRAERQGVLRRVPQFRSRTHLATICNHCNSKPG